MEPSVEGAAVLIADGNDTRSRALQQLLAQPPQLVCDVVPDPHRVDGLLERARLRPYDLVLLHGSADAVRRVRAILPAAAIVAIAQDAVADALREEGIDACVGDGEGAASVARCLRDVIIRNRLRAQLAAMHSDLVQTDARFRSIIQHNADGILILAADRTIRFANPAALRLFGRSADELIGREFGDTAVAGETTEIDIVRRDVDEPLVAELRVADTNWEGAPAQLVSLRDITDRKQAEQRAHHLLLEQTARERAEAATRRAQWLAGVGAKLDASLDIGTLLEALAALLVPDLADWCAIEVIGAGRLRHNAAAHADDATHDALLQLDLRDLTTEMLRLRVPAPLRTHAMLLIPLQLPGQHIGAIAVGCASREFDADAVALVHDVADRAARTIENARLYDAALAASRAKSGFLAVVSHELRTPLNAIMGYTEMLLEGIAGPVPDQQLDYLRRVATQARHLLQLIDEILSYTSIEAGRERPQPTHVTVHDLLRDVVAIAEPLARDRGLTLHVELEDPDLPLHTDARKVRHIVLSLLSNAVKFTERGSIELRAAAHGQDFVVRVTDTGIGVAPEHRATIFEPFWQAESPDTRRRDGTGMGLSVSRQLAAMLGGTLTVSSEPGAGSTFTLVVPVRLAPPANVEHVAAVPISPPTPADPGGNVASRAQDADAAPLPDGPSAGEQT